MCDLQSSGRDIEIGSETLDTVFSREVLQAEVLSSHCTVAISNRAMIIYREIEANKATPSPDGRTSKCIP